MGRIAHETGEDFEQSNFLNEGGCFHMLITQVDDPVTKGDGSLMDNAIFRAHCEVLAGTPEHCVGKTWQSTFFHSKPDATDKARQLVKKQLDRFYLAVNVIGDLERATVIEFDTEDLVAEQFIVKLEPKTNDNKTYMNVAGYGLDVYHVDDPAVAAFVAKVADKKRLALIDPGRRKIGGKPVPEKKPVPVDPHQAAKAGKEKEQPKPKVADDGVDFGAM